MKTTNVVYIAVLLFLSSCSGLKKQVAGDQIVDVQEVSRILKTLASDDMDGRATFTPGIEKAADFIANEFTKAGLEPMYEDNFRQTFYMNRITPSQFEVILDGQKIASEQIMFTSTLPGLRWNNDAQVQVLEIKAGDDFAQLYRKYSTGTQDAIVLVDESFASLFGRYRNMMMRGRMTADGQVTSSTSAIFVLGNERTSKPSSFRVNITNQIERLPLFNMVAIIPGKTRPNEYVVFSGHYDHIGRNAAPVDQDSIANGADDDASGVSAVLSLAKYYKKRNDNARTLIFVAFTAEEIGMYGSKYFSQQLNPDDVIALINIEMIGKDAKFGENSMYVTGFNHSNLANLMQGNLKGTPFSLHPDPYPTQNLFYRSDNATLAALGVPAHTFSTVQIEKDQYYHTVKDEVSTLNIKNIAASIRAIALGVESIISGKDTPTRVEKLKD